jgi:hypothetical protein
MFIRCRPTPGMPSLFNLSLHDDRRGVIHDETFLTPFMAEAQMGLYVTTIIGWQRINAEPTNGG